VGRSVLDHLTILVVIRGFFLPGELTNAFGLDFAGDFCLSLRTPGFLQSLSEVSEFGFTDPYPFPIEFCQRENESLIFGSLLREE
jgi:hypothetical protein